MPAKKNEGATRLTPMMEQYLAIRKSLPDDVLLFFRLGDFYELFLDDAKEAAGILDVALTNRNGLPMCGVPHHAAQGYIAKIIATGRRVAIAEQTTQPTPGKIVEREVTQVISAATVSDLNLLDQSRPNFLASVFFLKKSIGLAVIEHSTGEFRVTEMADAASLEDELRRMSPSETLVSDQQTEEFANITLPAQVEHDGYSFLEEPARQLLCEHLGVQSLDGFGCANYHAAVCAAGAALHYLTRTLRRKVDHLKSLRTYQTSQFVQLDGATQVNLDLIESRAGKGATLLGALDRTKTPMGARRLRDWIIHPLRDLSELTARQETVAAFLQAPAVLEDVRQALTKVRDVERIAARLSQNLGNARELQVLATSLAVLPSLREHLCLLATPDGLFRETEGSLPPPMWLQRLVHGLHDFSELSETVTACLVDDPPQAVKDGGLFRDGFSAHLDELRAASRSGKQWIAELQKREIEETGIKSLKVKFNNVFGYFIEVTKSNLHAVPDSYQRKQTTVNGERFITPELKEVENKILGADERARKFEYEQFLNLRESICGELPRLQESARILSEIDVLASFAETARLFQYCRPKLSDDHSELIIEDGRHPVLDQNLAEEKFVPNGVALAHGNGALPQLIVLTGPNMAGKSTYIRQVALLTLMAQIGSFLPARAARVGLVDRIFTRVGASDDLAKGQSTFMVEMNETALIVNNATERSLVILDEIGRGTATFDGLSIAWSVAEHLLQHVGCRCLFATHYHELTALARSHPTLVKNFNVAVREWNERIIFLRKIVEGAADKSYGIQVARLAGLPDSIISRAKEILSHLEKQNAEVKQEKKRRRKKANSESDGGLPDPQLTLW